MGLSLLLSASEWRFLGLDWSLWTMVGLAGNAVFSTRFFVQWIASEKRKESVIPVAFWWLSIAGSLILAIYFIGQREPVGVLATLPNSIIYARNLQFIYRKRKSEVEATLPAGDLATPKPEVAVGQGI